MANSPVSILEGQQSIQQRSQIMLFWCIFCLQISRKDADVRSGTPSRNLESAASTRSAPASFFTNNYSIDRHNLGLNRPRKLTPLEKLPPRPRTDEGGRIRIDQQQNRGNLHRPLHLSVNYTGNQELQGNWKQTLDPILQSTREDQRLTRKATFTVSKNSTYESPTPSSMSGMSTD
jgi:hypothetical protein